MTFIDGIVIDRLEGLNFAVYEYIEKNTDLVRYVGIVNKGTLANRHKQHMAEDWYDPFKYKIRYIECDNQSETESIESHLISSYPEDQLFNKAKKGWGLNKYLKCDFQWKYIEITRNDVLEEMEKYCSYSKYINEDAKRYIRECVDILRKVGD